MTDSQMQAILLHLIQNMGKHDTEFNEDMLDFYEYMQAVYFFLWKRLPTIAETIAFLN